MITPRSLSIVFDAPQAVSLGDLIKRMGYTRQPDTPMAVKILDETTITVANEGSTITATIAGKFDEHLGDAEFALATVLADLTSIGVYHRAQ